MVKVRSCPIESQRFEKSDGTASVTFFVLKFTGDGQSDGKSDGRFDGMKSYFTTALSSFFAAFSIEP